MIEYICRELIDTILIAKRPAPRFTEAELTMIPQFYNCRSNSAEFNATDEMESRTLVKYLRTIGRELVPTAMDW